MCSCCSRRRRRRIVQVLNNLLANAARRTAASAAIRVAPARGGQDVVEPLRRFPLTVLFETIYTCKCRVNT